MTVGYAGPFALLVAFLCLSADVEGNGIASNSSACLGITVGDLKQIVTTIAKDEMLKQLCSGVKPTCPSGPCEGKGLSTGNPAISCKDILRCNPSAPSGNYYIRIGGQPRSMYCYMDEDKCGVKGVMRVVYMNTKDPGYTCPSPLTTYTASGKRLCGGTNPSRMSCDSLTFPTHNFEYQHVCGRAIGYSYYHPCGFWTPPPSIDTAYIAGVAITHGLPGNRKHIWSYAGGFQETADAQNCNCPCAAAPGTSPGFYVGNDYYCESATRYRPLQFRWYTNNTLWDNQDCYPGSNCCSKPGAPWFMKTLPSPTRDAIELRWCTIQGLARDRVGTELVEIFVH